MTAKMIYKTFGAIGTVASVIEQHTGHFLSKKSLEYIWTITNSNSTIGIGDYATAAGRLIHYLLRSQAEIMYIHCSVG
jgi:hypothetical protein